MKPNFAVAVLKWNKWVGEWKWNRARSRKIPHVALSTNELKLDIFCYIFAYLRTKNAKMKIPKTQQTLRMLSDCISIAW